MINEMCAIETGGTGLQVSDAIKWHARPIVVLKHQTWCICILS